MQIQTKRSNQFEKYSSPNIRNLAYNQFSTPKTLQDKSIKKIQDRNVITSQSKKQIHQTQNNELQGFIIMLQNIEETLGENGIQYLSRVQEQLERLKIEYPNLKKLINLMFNQNKNEKVTQENYQEQKQLQQDELEKQKKQNKTFAKIITKLQQKNEEKTKQINELDIKYKEQQQKIQIYEKQIEDYENKIIKRNLEIQNLKQNIEDLQTQIKKKDEIYQQTLKEAKKISANALQEIATRLEIRHDQLIQVEKIHSDKLKQIKEKENGIKVETSELNQTIDEYLLIFKENPQSFELQRQKNLISQRCQNLKNLIQNVKVQLENYISSSKQPWIVYSNKNDSYLKQLLKNNLELILLYQKIFDNFQKIIGELLENSCQYQQTNVILKVKKNNSNISIILQNDNSSYKYSKQLYASINTKHNDTTWLKDNQSQTINEDSFELKQYQDESFSGSQSPNKKKKRQTCLTEPKQSIYGINQSIDSNN